MNAARSVPAELIVPLDPASTYEEACARFAAYLERDTAVIDPLSRSRLVTPGHRAERVVVFFHGLTNAPRQFDKLSERFIARGYAVLAPRVPYHGYLDRMSTDLKLLTVRDLVQVTAEYVDLAAGLADEVTVTGISMGGILAIWAAQYRPVALAAHRTRPGFAKNPLRHYRRHLRRHGPPPYRFQWWDPRVKQNLEGPPYAYPRFATHALVATQRLGLHLMNVARTERPAAQHIWMISNDADLAVSNSAAATLVRRWTENGASSVQAYRFPRQLKLFHDVVDPLQPNAQPDLVHPMLEQIMIDGTPPRMQPSVTT